MHGEPVPAVAGLPDEPAPWPLPAVVIGGYLGAGKTTLVNRLLRQAARAGAAGGGHRIAVLVNDFGEVSIDADLIVGADGGVLSLAGGCVCCSFGADLVGALAQVAARTPRPHTVLIEASGVGLPAAVARTASLAPQVRVQQTVVVADAAAVRAQSAERYVGGTVRRQLLEADLVLLGKTDLVEPAQLGGLETWLRGQGVAAPCLGMPPAGLDDTALAARVLGAATAPRDAFAARPWRPSPAAAAQRFVTRTHRFAAAVDAAALGAELLAQGVHRAKGVLLDAAGQWHELQVAGGRVDLRPAAAPVCAGDTAEAGAAAGRLVVISVKPG